MKQLTLSGVFPPVPTVFSDDGALAVDGLAMNLEFLSGYEMTGFVVLGSNGEAVHLTDSETITVLEAARAAIHSDRLMIAGTGRFSTRQTIEISQRAAQVGADAALVLPPCYYRGRMTREVLVNHFHSVADAVQIPVIVYNMPANTGIDLGAETVLEIADHDNIRGIKDSGGNVTKLAEIKQHADPEFSVLAGSAGFLVPALVAGASGGVMALANIAPQLCVDMYAAAERGDWAEAGRLQRRLVRANTAVTGKWGVAGLKAALDMQGRCGGIPRLPLTPLGNEQRNELRAILLEAGIDLEVSGEVE
jgi:4-hydroxy-2-oxoglutarate aldolase